MYLVTQEESMMKTLKRTQLKNPFLNLFSRKNTGQKFQKPTLNFASIHSIKTKFTLAFIGFAVIPVIILCSIYTVIAKRALGNTSRTLNAEIVKQISNNINTQLSHLEQSIDAFGITDLETTSANPIKVLNMSTSDKKTKQAAVISIFDQIADFIFAQPTIPSMCLISDNYPSFIGELKPFTIDTIKPYITEECRTHAVWYRPSEFNTQYSLIVKTFYDLPNQAYYSVALQYDMTNLLSYIDSTSLLSDATIYLVSDDDTIIYSNNPAIETLSSDIIAKLDADNDTLTFDTKKHSVSFATLSNNWKVIVETPVTSLTDQLNSARGTLFIILIIIVIIANLLGALYGLYFSKPIISLCQLMNQAEEGDLTVTASSKGKDEISSLCKSFNHMITNICSLIKQTQTVIMQTLESSDALHESTSNSVEAFNGLAQAVSEITDGTMLQARNSHKSNQDMSELSSSMEKVTRQTTSLLEHTDGAKSMIDEARLAMNSLTTAMSSSLEISNHISDSVVELSQLSQNIEDVMQLVDTISEQTNLLALNASIEAARVGEAGKGFAVVANEVRHLADQSKASTVNVRSTLATISSKMKDTVALTQASQDIIRKQENSVEDTHHVFEKIVTILGSMTSELHTINTSIQDMEKLKANMLVQIGDIANVSEEAAASTEEVNSLTAEQQNVIIELQHMASQLSENMQSLNTTIQNFKVE